MAYNKAREERKWKQWKEKEEKLLRMFGMDEDSIQKLRNSDWKDFKAERLYQKRWVDSPEYLQGEYIEDERQVIEGITGLLDVISDEQLFHILKETDRKTLQIIISKMMGFSVSEIAKEMEIPEQTIYTRMNRLKKKIKKIFKK